MGALLNKHNKIRLNSWAWHRGSALSFGRKARARRPAIAGAFAVIDALEAAGFAPAAIAPDHWRHVHNRLAINAAVRAYGWEQDRAWRARRAMVP